MQTAQKQQVKRLLIDHIADPTLFVRDCFGVSPTEQQAQILRSFAPPGSRTSVSSGHGIGKTTGLAWSIYWMLSLHTTCKVLCTAPTGPQISDALWAELAQWHNVANPIYKNQIQVNKDSAFRKDNPSGAFAVARTSRKENPEALQGKHSPNMAFVLDEASGIPDIVYEYGRGSMSTPGSRVILAGNPTQAQGFFFDSHHKNRHRWNCFQFSSIDSPLADREYIKEIAEEYGEDSDYYGVRILGRFPSSSFCQLIPTTLVDAAYGRVYPREMFNFVPSVLGVDVAWEGDDRSAVVWRQGVMSEVVAWWSKIDNMKLADIVAQQWQKRHAKACFVDIGWGAGVIDRLRQLGFNPIKVAFGGVPTDPRFADKRTEMWYGIREWLESGGALPADDALRADLVAPLYSMTPSGKILMERKKDLKKRKRPSPDLGDALALTFASNLARVSDVVDRQFVPEPVSHRARDDFDVLKLRRAR